MIFSRIHDQLMEQCCKIGNKDDEDNIKERIYDIANNILELDEMISQITDECNHVKALSVHFSHDSSDYEEIQKHLNIALDILNEINHR